MAWLRAQTELPGRRTLPEPLLHARRERLFALFAAIFVAGATLLPLLGTSRQFGVSSLVSRTGIEAPLMILVPAGAFGLPFALLALVAIADLYGSTRARMLVLAMIVVWGGVLGLHWATDMLPAYDGTTTTAFVPSLAVAACGLVTCVITTEVFAQIRARWLRHVVAPLLGIAAGWAVFGAIASQLAHPETESDTLGTAIGGGGYTWLVVVAGTLPVLLVTRALAIYLRVELRGRPSLDDDPSHSNPAFVGKPKKPFSTDEMAFFDAGDQP